MVVWALEYRMEKGGVFAEGWMQVDIWLEPSQKKCSKKNQCHYLLYPDN